MQLDKLYQNRFDKKDLTNKLAIWKVLCEDFFQQFIKTTDTVVDIGAGECEFLLKIRAERLIAVDPNLPFERGCIDTYPSVCQLSSQYANVIFMSNFLEHLPDKKAVTDMLTEAKRILKPGGKLIILQPNIKLTGGAYWDFFDHHTPLTDKCLVEALEMIDIKVVKVIERFLPYTTKSALPQHPLLVKLYLRLPFLWYFFGQQSLIIAEKQ